jgi:pimeloyl-ACP methyl ester carboxylesterase
MAPIARELAGEFRILEPFQRGSGGTPLTVACHLEDLNEVIGSFAGETPVHLVGFSWGAMLALAYAAARPGRARGLVLIGCGTFDPAARERFEATVKERMDERLRARMDGLDNEIADADERLRLKAELLLAVYSYDLVTTDLENERVDARANRESWEDMLRLQREGVYPAAFATVDAPVLMLHGARDPHPGRMIRASLEPHVPHLEYHEWESCGHYPWLENEVRDDFYARLRSWLSSRSAPT